MLVQRSRRLDQHWPYVVYELDVDQTEAGQSGRLQGSYIIDVNLRAVLGCLGNIHYCG